MSNIEESPHDHHRRRATRHVPYDSIDATDSGVTFRDLGLPDSIVHRLESQGKHTAFAIQAAVIPDALAGRDVAGRAPTGSGKTLGFGLPLVARLTDARAKRPVRTGARSDP